jgi:hypothetical protein
MNVVLPFVFINCPLGNSHSRILFYRLRFFATVHLDFSYYLRPPMRFFSLDEFNNLVRESPNLRSVRLPCQFVAPSEMDETDDSFHFFDAWFKSPQVSIRFSGVMPFAALHCIATFHQVAEITIEADSRFCNNDRNRRQQALQSYVQPFFREGSHLELLRIRFHGEGWPWWAPVELSQCMSRNLRFFSILWEPATEDIMQALDQVKRWGVDLFPTIVLNCYRHRLKKHFECGVFPLAIKAVNDSHIYRRCTNHSPCDIRLANAGLVFCIVREQVSDLADPRRAVRSLMKARTTLGATKKHSRRVSILPCCI